MLLAAADDVVALTQLEVASAAVLELQGRRERVPVRCVRLLAVAALVVVGVPLLVVLLLVVATLLVAAAVVTLVVALRLLVAGVGVGASG